MKKVTLLSIALVNAILFNTKALAQDESAFEKGTVVVTAGVGFPDFYRIDQRARYTGNSGYNSTSVKGFGPLIFKGDYGIIKFNWGHTLGAGIVLGYNATTVNFAYTDYRWNNNTGYTYYTYNQKDKHQTITVGARASYHFFTKEKVDCYANVGLGYNIRTYSRTTNDPNGGYGYAYGSSSAYTAFTAGIRYYFTKNFGVYAELGWDMSTPLQGGIALKF
ncbi:MAG: hypothetical protein K0R26_2796 [Bacteroidota bacterium]|jgi:hypothetical protein|nr:hypothetical protein [Bacteroidota bacterium]